MSKCVLIVASGTGGHIIPAKVIAQELEQKDIEVIFLAGNKDIEKHLLSDVKFAVYPLPFLGIKGRGVKGIVNFLINLPKAIYVAYVTIKRHNPQLIVGMGGYAVFAPVVLGKVFFSKRVILNEAELSLGLANKTLRFFADCITTAHKEVVKGNNSKYIYVGYPLRHSLSNIINLKPRKAYNKGLRILVLGGSQGADALDRAMGSLVDFFKANNVNIWHQARHENVEWLKEAYSKAGLSFKVEPYIEDMFLAYKHADIVISRAGAGACAELLSLPKPSILVPYPYAANNHQERNALLLKKAGKSFIVQNNEELASNLKKTIERLLSDKQLYFNMASVKKGKPKSSLSKVILEYLDK